MTTATTIDSIIDKNFKSIDIITQINDSHLLCESLEIVQPTIKIEFEKFLRKFLDDIIVTSSKKIDQQSTNVTNDSEFIIQLLTEAKKLCLLNFDLKIINKIYDMYIIYKPYSNFNQLCCIITDTYWVHDKNNPNLLKVCSKYAESCSDCRFALGQIYHHGFANCKVDLKKSYDIHLKNQNHAKSLNSLGFMSQRDPFNNLLDSEKYFHLAIKAGCHMAEYNLMDLYYYNQKRKTKFEKNIPLEQIPESILDFINNCKLEKCDICFDLYSSLLIKMIVAHSLTSIKKEKEKDLKKSEKSEKFESYSHLAKHYWSLAKNKARDSNTINVFEVDNYHFMSEHKINV